MRDESLLGGIDGITHLYFKKGPDQKAVNHEILIDEIYKIP